MTAIKEQDMRATLEEIADVFSIGSAARTPSTILANVRNASRRSDCLSAIEREFTKTVREDDEEYEQCPLNWGSKPEQYIEQFRAALQASKVEPAPSNMDMRAAFEKWYLDKFFQDLSDAAKKEMVWISASGNYASLLVEGAWQGYQSALSHTSPALVATWQPIDTAPKDNKRPLYLARINSKGELQEIDWDGTWELTSNGGEDYNEHSWHDWHSASGIEEPTHWAYQDEPIPPSPTPEQRVEEQQPVAYEESFIACPICGEPDMRKEDFGEGKVYIHCVNSACFSNGGGNYSALHTALATPSESEPALVATPEAVDWKTTLLGDDDTISRRAMIEAINEYTRREWGGEIVDPVQVISIIKKQPTAPYPPAPTQEQRIRDLTEEELSELGQYANSIGVGTIGAYRIVAKADLLRVDHPPQATKPAQEINFDLSESIDAAIDAAIDALKGDSK